MFLSSVEKARRLHEREVGFVQLRGIRRLASLYRVTKDVAIGLKKECDRPGLRRHTTHSISVMLKNTVIVKPITLKTKSVKSLNWSKSWKGTEVAQGGGRVCAAEGD